jgi:hypothetical protein
MDAFRVRAISLAYSHSFGGAGSYSLAKNFVG